MGFINRNILELEEHNVDSKNIKCPLNQSWKKLINLYRNANQTKTEGNKEHCIKTENNSNKVYGKRFQPAVFKQHYKNIEENLQTGKKQRNQQGVAGIGKQIAVFIYIICKEYKAC